MASKVVENVWQFNKSVHERNVYMFEKQIETDVIFKVSSLKGQPQTILAHKYMLISASPVFLAMLCGELREEGEIIVPDVEPEAFVKMLRYIYSENINLTGNHVMHVLHAAKKYQLPSLATLCTTYLDKELKASNACSILEHSRFFNEDTLAQKSLEKIEESTKEAMASEDFNSISHETLSVILDSDKLAIEEGQLFARCHEWATNKTDRRKTVRDVLGKNLFKIRFPTMRAQDFTDVVCLSLTPDEQLEIFKYLTSPKNSTRPKRFSCEARKPADRGENGETTNYYGYIPPHLQPPTIPWPNRCVSCGTLFNGWLCPWCN